MLWNEADMVAEFRRYLGKHLPRSLRMHSNVTKTYLNDDPNKWWKDLKMGRGWGHFDLVITDRDDIVYAVAEFKFPHHGLDTKKIFLSKLKRKVKLLDSVPKLAGIAGASCYSALIIIDGYFHSKRENLPIKSKVKKMVEDTDVRLYFKEG